jgi:hypothetical protein
MVFCDVISASVCVAWPNTGVGLREPYCPSKWGMSLAPIAR